MTERFTIYGLRLKGDKEARYIGQTNGFVEVRLLGHLSAAERKRYNPSLCDWLLANKDNVEAFKIAFADTREEARGIEKVIVGLCLRLEHRLFNHWLVPTELRIGWRGYSNRKAA